MVSRAAVFWVRALTAGAATGLPLTCGFVTGRAGLDLAAGAVFAFGAAEPDDADNPASWTTDALFQPESRAAFRGLKWLGLTDAYMAVDGAPGGYTFWDYQAGAWNRNHGIRIDHLLLSPQAADRLERVVIHRDTRARDKPSDHVPVVAELRL